MDGVIGRDRVDALCGTLNETTVIDLVRRIGRYGIEKLVDGLADAHVVEVLSALDPGLLPKIFKGRQPATGREFHELVTKFGPADVNQLAAPLGGKLAQFLRGDIFHLDDPAQRGAVASGAGRTARDLPELDGMTIAQTRSILVAAGMTMTDTKPDHEMWTHPDLSVVRLKTGPAAWGMVGRNHAVVEVTKIAHATGDEDVYAKFQHGGHILPQGTSQAVSQVNSWFKEKSGRPATSAETVTMMNWWARLGHRRLT